jgi:succinate dehydrogenase / fumarate reductase iron-sulfur subunit
MKERVVDRRYDPLVRLGRKIFRRDQLPAMATSSAAAEAPSSARGPQAPSVGADGKLDVAELLAQHQGGPSPFGDEQEFPLASGGITYVHPEPEKD